MSQVRDEKKPEQKASRRLDAEVAVAVMGWTTEPVTYKGEPGLRYTSPDGRTEISWDDEGMLAPNKVPSYSRHIADAWLVANRLHLTVSPRLNKWRAFQTDAFRSEEGIEYIGTQTGMVEADSAPVAICLAALAIVGNLR